MNNFTTIKIKKLYIIFGIILFFTLLNGFFNSISVAYGWDTYPYNTFLFSATDLHADLIKGILSYCNSLNLDTSEWSTLYQNYYHHNPYGGIEALQNGRLSNLSGPPLMLNIGFLLKYILIHSSPEILVELFYIFVILSIYFISKFFMQDDLDLYVIFFTMLFSYTILFVLTRGHIYAFINGVTLMIFFYLIINKQYVFISIILLSFIINIRPNAIIFSILFFVYGYKNAFKYTILLLALSGIIFIVNLYIAHYLYHDYTWNNFLAAIKIYFELYVIGGLGNLFNNSILGAVKTYLLLLDVHLSKSALININSTIGIISFITVLVTAFKYFQKRLTIFEFIFIVTSIYVMASSVFGTYHMFIFFIFILIPLKSDWNKISPQFLYLIFFSTIFVLSPKNYFFIGYISLETILNPLVLLLTVLYILIKTNKRSKMDIHEKN